MKKIIVALIMASASVAAQAAPPSDWKDRCKSAEKLAAGLMELRQEGVPLSIVLDSIKGNAAFDKMVEGLALDAWEVPVVDDAAWKKTMISQFRDKWYLECVKVAKAKK